ncbi:dockerin type I domain-containing protein [Acetivibrio cellulolyticus]|uniref:dockerin type I domain-containing protein n=1 Tax=Acetivibrio cellulolyticus TaxID=35830 RepID=UPI0001E2E79F|nr:dockerin type I domain-containing protein [Acetivibrio cellulolyticus]
MYKSQNIKRLSILLAFSIVLCTLFYLFPSKLTYAASSFPAMLPISRGVPAFGSVGVASNANDNNYGTAWYGGGTSWLAYDLSSVPVDQRKQIIVVWYNTDTYDYDTTQVNTSSYHKPKNYTIEANSASGGSSSAPTSGWTVLATVSNNNYHSRQHLVDFTGYNWIRINITDSLTNSVNINMDIHNASLGTQDDWIIYGDSITAGGTALNGNGKGTIAQIVNSTNSAHFPVVECGGTGSILSRHGSASIDAWLSVFPGKYVGVAFGTNDAWGNQTGADNYYKNMVTIVNAIISAGKVPVVAKIPWSNLTAISQNLPSYNAKIEELYLAYPEIIKGPDFYTFFQNNPTLISSDNVHPSTEGYNAMREQWAKVILSIYENSTVTPTPSSPSFVYGDINGSGALDSIDFGLLRQYLLGMKTSFDYTYGAKAADVNNDGAINSIDFGLMRQRLLGIITKFPAES